MGHPHRGPVVGLRPSGPASRKPLGLAVLRATVLATVLLPSLLLPAQTAQGQVEETILLTNTILFVPELIVAESGGNVSLHLFNDGNVPHTFTLFMEPNAQVPFGNPAALREYNRTHDKFVDIDDKFVDIALEGGEEAWVNFTAPDLEADYFFVCMVPGHGITMNGRLQVGQGPGVDFGIGIVQGLLIVTLIGVAVFAVIYHVRSTRP